MLLPGTEMHIATFIFVCIEIVIFFYLIVYRLARPDDKKAYLNVFLILLLIIYNVSGGLLPDTNLPGSYFVQTSIAYGTGFITPCYFPYYVYHAFGLEKMKFHVYRGVYLFLILPYLIFITAFGITDNLGLAKQFLILPVAYAVWVVFSLNSAIRFKYGNKSASKAFKEEASILFMSIAAWVGLPVIDYFNIGQATEAIFTNVGFLLLLGLHVKRHIRVTRTEHQKLIESEARLLNWNTSLQNEVEKRTIQLERLNEQRIHTFVNLAHETKTPLTLIGNYLEDYLSQNPKSEEFFLVKRSFDKLSQDIGNLFDLEKFSKGFSIYNHDLIIINCSEIIQDSLILFQKYAVKRNIKIKSDIEKNIYTKANPLAINRIVNNLVENAIKYSFEGGSIEITLREKGDRLGFRVKDEGIGIPASLQKKVFEPYFQISNAKGNFQGMGLGLPIVKKVVEDLKGEVYLTSAPHVKPGTEIEVILTRYQLKEEDVITTHKTGPVYIGIDRLIPESEEDINRHLVLIVEDNISMASYLQMKLRQYYNVLVALNGNEALKLLKERQQLPDIILSDVMMDKLDGYAFAKIISNDSSYKHIPIVFLSAISTKEDKLRGLKLGAIDFIQKPFSISELIQKINSLLAVFSSQKKSLLKAALASSNKNNDLPAVTDQQRFERNCQIYNLTLREKDIAKLVCQGYKYKSIGESLYISERTVTKHIQNIFEKLAVSNKIELINKLESIPALPV